MLFVTIKIYHKVNMILVNQFTPSLCGNYNTGLFAECRLRTDTRDDEGIARASIKRDAVLLLLTDYITSLMALRD